MLQSPKMQTILQLLGIVSCFALLITFRVNTTTIFGGPKGTDYVDSIITLADIALVGLFGYISFLKPKMLWVWLILAIQTLVFGYLNNASILQGQLYVIRYILLFVVLFSKYTCKESAIKACILLAMVFDHYLISQSIPLLIVCICGIISVPWIKLWLPVYVWIISIVALLQAVLQRSIGLVYLGEPVYTTITTGIGKIQFNGNTILRSPGVFSHPNVLGFVLSIILTQTHKWYHIIPIVLGIIVSGSRLAIGFAGIYIMYYYVYPLLRQKITPRLYRYVTLVTGAGSLLAFILVFIIRSSADVYRILDIQQYVSFVWQNPFSLLTGVGAGQYSVVSVTVLPYFEFWQQQPVHSVFFMVVIEFGLPVLIGSLLYLNKTILRII